MSTDDPTPIRGAAGDDAPSLPAVPDARANAIRRTMDRQHVAAGTSRRIKHGIYAVSESSVRAEVIDEASLIFGRAPWLDEARDGLAVESVARLAVRLRRLDVVLAEGEAGQTLTSLYARCEQAMIRALSQLGLTPTSAASLGLAHMDAAGRARAEAERALTRYASKPKRKTPR